MNNGLSRRGLVAGSAAGVLATMPAAAETLPGGAAAPPKAGSDERITLPPLHAKSEQQGVIANPDAPARRLGVAVVGLGHLSLEQILPGFGEAKHVRLAALVSGDPEKRRVVAAQHGVPADALYDYRDFERLRDDPRVDVVYVVLPNAMHREFTERAAAAGKHVLCEKPMATSSADAQAMVDAVRAAGRKLMVAYRSQYEPTNRALIEVARSGQLGPLRLIQAVNGQNDTPGQWRQNRAMAGGGSLPDVGIYCLNAARYVTGEEPVEVTATLTRPEGDPRFREVEDICSFTLRFPSGVLATCTSGYSHHESRWLRVIGTDGWAELDPAFGYSGQRMRLARQAGGAQVLEERRFEQTNQFAREMDGFAVAIRDGVTPGTPGEEGVADMRLIEAIYHAAESGGAVHLPEVAGRDTTRGVFPPA